MGELTLWVCSLASVLLMGMVLVVAVMTDETAIREGRLVVWDVLAEGVPVFGGHAHAALLCSGIQIETGFLTATVHSA